MFLSKLKTKWKIFSEYIQYLLNLSFHCDTFNIMKGRMNKYKLNKCLTACSYHVTYAFQSESILYSYLNIKELVVRCRCDIWRLSDWNRTWTHNQSSLGVLTSASKCCFILSSKCFSFTIIFVVLKTVSNKIHFKMVLIQSLSRKKITNILFTF